MHFGSHGAPLNHAPLMAFLKASQRLPSGLSSCRCRPADTRRSDCDDMPLISRCPPSRIITYMDDDGRGFLIRYAIGFLLFALIAAGLMEWLDSILAPAS